MVRFSCFQARIHSHKQKKTTQLPAESMQKTLEDTSEKWAHKNFHYTTTENKPCLTVKLETKFNVADHATDSSPTERDCRLEETKSEYCTGYDVEAHKNGQMKKSQSLGSELNWKERNSGGDCSEGEMEQKFSYDGSADGRGVVVSDGIDVHVLSLSEQCQEHIPSDSAVNSDFVQNVSMFCIGDSQQSEKEGAYKDDLQFSGANATSGHIPHTPCAILKSSSLPNMASSNRHMARVLHCSRSAGNLSDLDSEKKFVPTHDTGNLVENLGIDYAIINNDNDDTENPAEDAYESYNYVGSAKEWIIPVSEGTNMEKTKTEENSFHRWDDVPSKDLRLRRIEEWVLDLQHCSPLKEESSEFAIRNDYKLSKSDALLEDSTAAAKLEVKVNPGMEAAKKCISSLNASATAVQLANLGLAVIPYLSPFVSLKALNVSGNSIVRITSGALPRGLQILNLSKNSISTIEGLRDLTRLRVIDLSFNRLLRIGHGLASCSSLKELYLAGNKISEVEGLHRLLKLNVLDLRFNKICTAKCLGQLAANHGSLQALSLEGNPAQKNVGDEQLKKYVQSLLPHLIYYNRQSIKVGTTKDITADRSARLGISGNPIDRGLRAELKTVRKGAHGIIAQKTSSSSIHGRKHQATSSQRPSRTRLGRLPPTGIRTSQGPQAVDFSNKLLSLKSDLSMRRSRSEGTLGAP